MMPTVKPWLTASSNGSPSGPIWFAWRTDQLSQTGYAMFGYMIKKAFFDYWDHFFHMAVLNIVLVFSLAIPFGLAPLIVSFSPLLSLIVLILGLLWVGAMLSASSLYVNEIAQFRQVEAKQFFLYLKDGWKHGVLFAVIWGLAVFLVWMTFPFYSGMQNIAGTAALAFLFWTLVIFVLAMQYYFPVFVQLDKKPRKNPPENVYHLLR
jgi:hypothetical protein